MKAPEGFLWVPKTGRKLLLGKKSTPMVIIMSKADGQQKEQIQDLVIEASYVYRVFHAISYSGFKF